MKKIKEQKQTLQDIEELIPAMQHEIDELRNIVYRYMLLHGNEIKGGIVVVPDNLYYSIAIGNVNGACIAINTHEIKMESDYQKLKRQIDKLK
jgi:hypothetical protein